LNPLSLYIHFPFCRSKCRYCDFVSSPVSSRREAGEYMEILARELELAALLPGLRGRRVTTVYFGGGTPSIMDPAETGMLLGKIGDLFGVEPGAEVTIEANPGTVEDPAGWMAAVRKAGVNRLVAGVQSMDDGDLDFLGRRHDAAGAGAFLEAALGAGFRSVGLDLIYGLPGRDVRGWLRNLGRVIGYRPHHVSMYCLEMPAGTPLGKMLGEGRITECSPEVQAEMYRSALEVMAAAGYRQYEMSNFALPGHECRHNMVYWTGGDYLGAGVSACSMVEGERWSNVRDTGTWKRKIEAGMPPVGYRERLSAGRRLREHAVLRLRTSDGIDMEGLGRGYPEGEIEKLGGEMRLLESRGLVLRRPGGFRMAPADFFVSDSVFSSIV